MSGVETTHEMWYKSARIVESREMLYKSTRIYTHLTKDPTLLHKRHRPKSSLFISFRDSSRVRSVTVVSFVESTSDLDPPATSIMHTQVVFHIRDRAAALRFRCAVQPSAQCLQATTEPAPAEPRDGHHRAVSEAVALH